MKVFARVSWRACYFAAAAMMAVLAPAPALAAQHTANTVLSGSQEVPANSSTASGTCTATVDDVTGNVSFSGTFSGLRAAASSAQVRGLAGPGVTGPVILSQTTVTFAQSGTFFGSGVVSPQSVAGILVGEAYCEIDDAAFPSGEIRGQLSPPFSTQALPAWLSAGLGALLLAMGCLRLTSDRRVAHPEGARGRAR
jgi:hypothetical protein